MGEEDQYAASTRIESRIFYDIPGFFMGGGGVQCGDVQTFAQKCTPVTAAASTNTHLLARKEHL